MIDKFLYSTRSLITLTPFFSLRTLINGLDNWESQVKFIFLAEIILTIALIGFMLVIFQRKNRFTFKTFFSLLSDKINNLPSVFWVALGVMPPFIRFFIFPIFFGPGSRIHYLNNYLPENRPIGHDFLLNLDALENWFEKGQTTSFVYTPLAHIVFAPALLLEYPKSYYALTLLTLTSYLILFFLALQICNPKNHAVIAFISVISIFSYGLQFELERGQSYTLTFMLLMLSIYIFHKFPEFRLPAYILFSISIQLKYFPAFFIIMFVDDWRDWKTNLKRFVSLGIVNFLLLFIFGLPYYKAFYDQMFAALTYPVIGEGVHSIGSFTSMLQDSGIGLFHGNALIWIKDHINPIENSLYLYFAICFLFILVNAWTRNLKGVNIDLLAICLIGGILLPQSHDYTLPMLAFPFAMLISEWHKRDYPWAKIFTVLVIIFISFTYALTLPPYTVRHSYIKNSMPMLYAILTAVTIMYLAQKREISPS